MGPKLPNNDKPQTAELWEGGGTLSYEDQFCGSNRGSAGISEKAVSQR